VESRSRGGGEDAEARAGEKAAESSTAERTAPKRCGRKAAESGAEPAGEKPRKRETKAAKRGGEGGYGPMKSATVVGAGLAGCEAAWQLARRDVPVRLCEMKPAKKTPAHVSDDFAELVCSNSLRSDELTNAVGLLKEEMRRLGSLIMEAATPPG
jgi:hypothetical protein